MPVDTKEIIEKYKRLHIDQLVELAAAPGELRADVLPFLQQELLQRGRTTEAQRIADWIELGGDKQQQEELQVNIDTDEWLKEARKRANNDEALEDIVKEANERGGGTLDALKKKGWYQEAYVDYIKELRSKGLTDEQINQKLGIAFSLADANNYRQRLKRNAVFVIIGGVIALGRGVTGYEQTKKFGGGTVEEMINTAFLIIGLALFAISIVSFIKSKE